MENKMSKRQIAYLKKIKAAEKVRSIQSKMVSFTGDGRPILTSQSAQFLPELRKAEEEYQKATKEFLDSMLEQ